MSLVKLQTLDTNDPQWHALLKTSVDRILQAGAVSKIIVFGSFAAGKMTQASDIDLLVVIADHDNPRSFRRRIPSPLSTWPTDLVIVTESRFNERKDFGGVIMEAWDHGVELYPQWCGAGSTIPKGRKYKPEYAQELLRFARGDLGSALDLLDGARGRPENICYLAQQSIEKSLKAVACHLGLELVHTHDMEALVAMLPSEHRPPETFELKELTEYATVRRYEEGYTLLAREDLENVIRVAQRTHRWACKKTGST